VQPARRLIVTALVVAYPPEPLASFLADGGYLSQGVPLITRILALPGQTVCRPGLTIMVDGIDMGPHVSAISADACSRSGRVAV